MGRRLTFGQGSIRVTMDDALERLARRAIDRVAPGVLGELEATVDRLEADARGKWPVKTGRSRDGLSSAVTVQVQGERVRATLLNAVDYAVYIKAKSLGGKSAVVELLRRPVRAEAGPLADRLAELAKQRLSSG